jgi:predicted RecB family nuclease
LRNVYDHIEPTSIEETKQALLSGPQLIVAPRLPDDANGRRARVDALWRLGKSGDRFVYAPIAIKNNEVVETASSRSMRESPLDNCSPVHATIHEGLGPRSTISVTRNGLSLAHASRVLQELGHGNSMGHVAMVDRNQRMWWFSLSDANLPRFSFRHYDEAFAERHAILLALDTWHESGGAYPTEPYWHRECEDCPFVHHCYGELRVRDDVSLVRFSTREQQVSMRSAGVATVADLAALDPQLARVGKRSVEDAPREAQLAHSIERLTDLIYRARVMTWGSFLRVLDAEQVSCPTADVEVDVDMESYNDRTYLWGATVRTTRPGIDVIEGYFPFVTWGDLTETAEQHVFLDFWQWLSTLRSHVEHLGFTFAAYCFWAQAENGAMDRALDSEDDSLPVKQQVAAFRNTQPPVWIDLHEHAKRCIQTEGPLGLKHIAKGAGFVWRDENPSGEASMLWYEIATSDGEDAALFRQRILDYNEDDCRATAALRDWLNGDAKRLVHRDGPRP